MSQFSYHNGFNNDRNNMKSFNYIFQHWINCFIWLFALLEWFLNHVWIVIMVLVFMYKIVSNFKCNQIKKIAISLDGNNVRYFVFCESNITVMGKSSKTISVLIASHPLSPIFINNFCFRIQWIKARKNMIHFLL